MIFFFIFKKMDQTYIFWISKDYRSGTIVSYEKCKENEDIADKDIYELGFEVNLTHPAEHFKVYLLCEFDRYEIINEWEFKSKRDATNHINKAYSQLEGTLPFVVTGHTCSYKETGYYPKIPEDILKMDKIELGLSEYTDDHYFMVMLDSKQIIQTQMITFP